MWIYHFFSPPQSHRKPPANDAMRRLESLRADLRGELSGSSNVNELDDACRVGETGGWCGDVPEVILGRCACA